MPIVKVETSRLYRRIADQIRALILTGEFPPGSRLPPERDLAQQFGVSRPSLREALIALEIEGLVAVMTGSGIYVRLEAGRGGAADPEESTDQTDAGPGPFELVRARQLIEPPIAALAADEATAADLAALRDAVEQMEAQHHREQSSEAADRLFHLALADATQNSALTLVVQGLWDQGRGRLWRKMQERMHSPGLRPRWIGEHRAVLDGVAAHDPTRARAAMSEHLAAVEQELDAAWAIINPQPAARVANPVNRRRRAP